MGHFINPHNCELICKVVILNLFNHNRSTSWSIPLSLWGIPLTLVIARLITVWSIWSTLGIPLIARLITVWSIWSTLGIPLILRLIVVALWDIWSTPSSLIDVVHHVTSCCFCKSKQERYDHINTFTCTCIYECTPFIG